MANRKEQTPSSIETGPLQRALSHLAVPEAAVGLPRLASGLCSQLVAGLPADIPTEREGTASNDGSPVPPVYKNARYPDESAEASSYCSSPQFVYSSIDSSSDTSSTVDGLPLIASLSVEAHQRLGQKDDLIPAVWTTPHSEQLTPSSTSRLPRYQPQLQSTSKSDRQIQSRDSHDDDAWLEFKHSLLGPDWMHERWADKAKSEVCSPGQLSTSPFSNTQEARHSLHPHLPRSIFVLCRLTLQQGYLMLGCILSDGMTVVVLRIAMLEIGSYMLLVMNLCLQHGNSSKQRGHAGD